MIATGWLLCTVVGHIILVAGTSRSSNNRKNMKINCDELCVRYHLSAMYVMHGGTHCLIKSCMHEHQLLTALDA